MCPEENGVVAPTGSTLVLTIRAYSHQAKVRGKAKRSKNNQKESKNKWKISKKLFAFARCEWALNMESTVNF